MINKKDFSFTVTITPTAPLLLFAFVVLLTLGYSMGSPKCQEAIVYFTACVGVSATLAAAYFAGRAMKASISATEANSCTQKIRMAFDFSQRLGSAGSVEVRAELNQDIKTTSEDRTSSTQYERIMKDPKLFKNVLMILGEFEDMAIAIDLGVADEEFLKRSLVTMVRKYYRGYLGFIKGLRDAEKHEGYYIELEKLHERWK